MVLLAVWRLVLLGVWLCCCVCCVWLVYGVCNIVRMCGCVFVCVFELCARVVCVVSCWVVGCCRADVVVCGVMNVVCDALHVV